MILLHYNNINIKLIFIKYNNMFNKDFTKDLKYSSY